jgi:hypothetical protein
MKKLCLTAAMEGVQSHRFDEIDESAQNEGDQKSFFVQTFRCPRSGVPKSGSNGNKKKKKKKKSLYGYAMRKHVKQNLNTRKKACASICSGLNFVSVCRAAY